jgi:uncharacterized protein (TIGR03437 family)
LNLLPKLRPTVICLCLLPLLPAPAGADPPTVKTYGIGFSPYINGQDPNLGVQITATQIRSRLQVVAPYTTWIRTFGSSHGLEATPAIAREFSLRVAATAWIGRDANANSIEIANLIAAVNAGYVDVALVGSESVLRNDVTVAQLIIYMNQVRAAIPANVPVSTSDVWGTFITNPSLIAASDQIWANLYPYWESTEISSAVCSLQSEYAQLVAVSGAKTVVIGESGWPSAGNAHGAAIPSVANANLYAQQFLTWANASHIPNFYFEFYDENWKASYEGPQGAHFGILDANAVVKPGTDAYFNGQVSAPSCGSRMLPGPVGITFVYVPPYGSTDALEALVSGVQSGSYVIATYIYIGSLGTWWTKPTMAQPTVTVNPNGTASIVIDSGGIDIQATAIAAFLIPASVTPPVVLGGALPAVPSAVATLQVTRTQKSVSGTVTNSLNVPIWGATVTSPTLGTTTTGPDGKYSFYNVTSSGTVNLTISYPNYLFPASPATITLSSGNQQVNFAATPTVDLAVNATVSPNPVALGSTFTETIVVSNAGAFAASDVVLTAPVPSSVALVTATTTRGTCSTGTRTIVCDVGALVPTAFATVNLTFTVTALNSLTLTAGAAGPDPDSNPANNSFSQNLAVFDPRLPSLAASGIVPIYSNVPVVQSGSWISIFGTNLASGTTIWRGDFPTSLGDVIVKIDNKPAYLWYVSPTQINAQVPDDAAIGSVSVSVTTSIGTATSNVTLAAVGPSFSLLDSKHVAGIIVRPDGTGAYGTGLGSYDIVGPVGSSLGYGTVPAKAGDTVVIFGVGFGPTSPPVPAGQPWSGTAVTLDPVVLSIGSTVVKTFYTGLSGAGLFQINLVVPPGLGVGDVPLLATVAGSQTPAGVVISLR